MAEMRRHIIADTFAAYRDAQRLRLGRGDDQHPSVVAPRRRHRRDDADLDGFAVRRSPQGHTTVVHRASGEMMHGGLDPAIEANALYVEQSRLRERLCEPTSVPLVVWDVGMGPAHNAM